MQITAEWLASIQDEDGLTRGQKQLLSIWEKRQFFVGWGYLPDVVAHVIATCRGYRGMTPELRILLAYR